MAEFLFRIVLLLFLAIWLSFAYAIEESTHQALLAGDIVISEQKQGDKVITTANVLVVAEMALIKKVLLECKKHIDFIPSYKTCDNKYLSETSIYGSVEIAPPFTDGIKYYLHTQLASGPNTFTISWRMDRTKTVSYMKDTYGFWEIKRFNDKAYLLTMYTDTDFKFHWLINWFLEPIIRSLIEDDLPNVLAGVRARIETNEQWDRSQALPEAKIKKEDDHVL